MWFTPVFGNSQEWFKFEFTVAEYQLKALLGESGLLFHRIEIFMILCQNFKLKF